MGQPNNKDIGNIVGCTITVAYALVTFGMMVYQCMERGDSFLAAVGFVTLYLIVFLAILVSIASIGG